MADANEMQAIVFAYQIFKVQTLVDGGVRLTLDLEEPIDDSVVVSLVRASRENRLLQSASVILENE